MIALVLATLLFTAGPSQAQTALLKAGSNDSQAALAQMSLNQTTDMNAAPAGISVRLRCVAQADGVVGGCRVIEETRPGLGFGDAAVALMNGSPVDPAWREGQSGNVAFEDTIEFTP